ncbi:MAG: ribosome biogenesis GTP-binding protein YihA/YsxC [Clostridiales bacterium]|jgi:GTP-binding protein|nr:ribosome biogenesis GTP-binding protein YihA/YsxC [Clostridiales bacterium]
MIVNNVFLKAVGVKPSQFPDDKKPEIAFVGKSNVGKSSLINTLINRKSLARTSQSPGKTRTVNFYEVEGKLCFVDLPGYGYAKTSKSESEKWGKMIEGYLLNRKQLRAILLLVDIRHELSANDKLMYDWLMHYNYKMIVALTKSDKLTRNQMARNLAMFKKEFIGAIDVVPFSSLNKSGRDELWGTIGSLIETIG